MLAVGKSRYRVCGCSLYYSYNFSIGLEIFQNEEFIGINQQARKARAHPGAHRHAQPVLNVPSSLLWAPQLGHTCLLVLQTPAHTPLHPGY